MDNFDISQVIERSSKKQMVYQPDFIDEQVSKKAFTLDLLHHSRKSNKRFYSIKNRKSEQTMKKDKIFNEVNKQVAYSIQDYQNNKNEGNQYQALCYKFCQKVKQNIQTQKIFQKQKQQISSKKFQFSIKNQYVRSKEQEIQFKVNQQLDKSRMDLQKISDWEIALNKNYQKALEDIQLFDKQYQKICEQIELLSIKEKQEKMKNQQKIKNIEILQNEIQIFDNSLNTYGIQIAILNAQLGKKLRCGFSTYFNHEKQIQNIANFVDWKRKKTKNIHFSQIRTSIISKLYPGMKQIFNKFITRSSVFKVLFNHKYQQNLTHQDFTKLNNCLFSNIDNRIPNKFQRPKIFFAVGSIERDLFHEYISMIKNDLIGFQGYLLKVISIQTTIAHELPIHVQTLIINYTFDNQPYKRFILFFNLGSNFDLSIIEPFICKFKKKSQIGTLVHSLLGDQRNGYMILEIPKMIPVNKSIDYSKLYDAIKIIK